MYAIATFLVVAVFTMVFGRLATGALIATGVPPEIAAFQSRSAFSGAGFTTTETESVINHPMRRKIISTTMFVGSLGTPTLIVAVLIGFMAPGPGSTTERTLVTISGIVLIAMLIGNRPATDFLVKVGHRYANKRLIPVLSDSFETLLTLGDDFAVGSISLAADPADTYRSLRGLDEAVRGVRVLGIRRGDEYFGETPIDIELRQGDEILVYARLDQINSMIGNLR
jgi:Trk-type K+ transport system membrane component